MAITLKPLINSNFYCTIAALADVVFTEVSGLTIQNNKVDWYDGVIDEPQTLLLDPDPLEITLKVVFDINVVNKIVSWRQNFEKETTLTIQPFTVVKGKRVEQGQPFTVYGVKPISVKLPDIQSGGKEVAKIELVVSGKPFKRN